MTNGDPQLLVSVERLRKHLNDPRWRVVDVRHDLFDQDAGIRAYRAGHIPGAVFANIDVDLSGKKSGSNGRHPLPPRDAAVEAFQRWGINADTQIVAYDSQGGQFAARMWWVARWLGHQQVALLDGGWPAWLANTDMASTSEPDLIRGKFTARESLVPLSTVDQVQRSLHAREHVLLDARAPERYRGEQEPIDPVAGHIPGAFNRPWQSNLNSDQTFKPASQLRSEFEQLMQRVPATQITHQCGSGVTACHNVFAMELAGLPGSSLYGGSWSEWIADPSRPIATGNEPSRDES